MSVRRIVRWSLLGAAGVFVAIQFIRPSRDLGPAAAASEDFIVKYNVPETFGRQLRESCYDCHSDQVHYPWYANVQPVGWWLKSHIDEGREELNLSRIGSYSASRRADKVYAMADEISYGSMPLKSYTLIHRNAVLSPEEAKALAQWLESLAEKLEES